MDSSTMRGQRKSKRQLEKVQQQKVRSECIVLVEKICPTKYKESSAEEMDEGQKSDPEKTLSIASMDSSTMRGQRKRKHQPEPVQQQEVRSECIVLVEKICPTKYKERSAEEFDQEQKSDQDSSNMRESWKKRCQLEEVPQQEVRSECIVLVNENCERRSLLDKESSSEESADEGGNSDAENNLSISTDASYVSELQSEQVEQEFSSDCEENALNVCEDSSNPVVECFQRPELGAKWEALVKKNCELGLLKIDPEMIHSLCMEASKMEELQMKRQLEKNQENSNSKCKVLAKSGFERKSPDNDKDEILSAEEESSDTNGALLPGGHLLRKKPVVKLSRLALKPEIEKESTDESDDAQEQSDLPAYERKRLKNMKENSKFLNSLELLKAASNLFPAKKAPQKRVKTPKTEETDVRRSRRLQRLTPAGVKPLPGVNTLPKVIEIHPEEMMKPPGPLHMISTNGRDPQPVHAFLRAFSLLSQDTDTTIALDIRDPARYESYLRVLKLREVTVAKVVPGRICSLAMHPASPRYLVAAGDITGHVGLYDVKCRPVCDSVYMFAPHTTTVSTLQFSPWNSAHLLSLSYDGTVRCADFNYFVFDEVYRDEEGSFSSFDFLTQNGSVLIVSHRESLLSVVDLRTPGTSYEIRASVGMSRCRTVNVHPLRKELCVVAGASDVFIYDVRKLYSKKTQPVLTVPGHTKSVSSAYFSPQTGHRILTTCADDFIRIYNSNTLGTSIDLLTKIRHNNHTGRWLSPFRAVWDPKQENYFAVGSLERPRRIEVFHERGDIVHTLCSEQYLSSVCSINAFHPLKNLIVGGNSSGRVHLFTRTKIKK